MSETQFSQEELGQIREMQEKYNALGIQLVQLKLAKSNAVTYLKNLEQQEIALEAELLETNRQEKELAKSLDDKYGAGSVDLETGQFTPNAPVKE